MDAIVAVALPLFLLMAIGYVVVRARLVPDGTVPGLNGFAFHVAIPALLFDKIRTTPLAALLDVRFVVAYYAPTLLLFFATFLVSWLWLRTERRLAVIQGLATIFTNSGYMGIALLLTMGGPALALPAVLIVALDNLIVVPIALALLEAGGGRQGRFWPTLGRSLATHPIILAVFFGVVAGSIGFVPPGPLQRVIELLAAATVPCALFALGGSLVGVPISDAKREVATLSLLKMLVHPALVAVFVYLVVPLEPTLAATTVIVTALPAATMVYVMAQRYECYVLRSSTIVLVTHVISVVTVSALLAFYGPLP
ncbi:MAG: AEC family transporter [Geminicoccaceae bacterium]|nr:MAG: AEC family transporter [Geminicoccaceae bacterium]